MLLSLRRVFDGMAGLIDYLEEMLTYKHAAHAPHLAKLFRVV